MSIGLPRRTPTNKRVVACNICGKVWNVAATQDTQKGYYCPECSKGRGAKHENRTNQRNSAKETVCRQEG
jgi:hypothetical protein